jgi:hypothetical protein
MKILPLLVILLIVMLMLAAKLAHADESRPWTVYQDGFRCCQFFNLSSAQAYVKMQEPYGNSYMIAKEN